MSADIQQSVRRAIQKQIQVVEASMYLSVTQSALTGNSWNKINVNTAIYDVGKNFDTVNHKFIVPVTGLYRVEADLHFTVVTTAKRYLAAIYKNASAIKVSYQHAGLAADLAVRVNAELFLQQNDYIELYGQPELVGNTVGALGGSLYTNLTVRLLTKEGIRQ